MDAGEDRQAGAARRRVPWRRIAIALAVVAALLGVGMLAGRWLGPEVVLTRYDRLRAEVDAHFLRTMVLYVAGYAVVVALSMPGSAMLSLLGGLLFGWFWGGIAAVTAATAGAVVVFLVARTTLGAWLARASGPRLARIAQGLRDDAASYMLFLRLVPLFPFFLVNLAPALVGIRLRTFVWTTALGIVPAAFTITTAGAGFDSVVRAQKAAFKACVAAGSDDCRFDLSLQSIFTPGVLAAFAALGCLALIPVVLRRTGLLGRRAEG